MRFLFATILLLASVQGGLAEQGEATAPEAGRAAIPSVTVASARLAEVEARVLMSGTLVARQEVMIFPQVSGFEITEILVEAGDRVEKGQVLVRLARDTLSAQLAQAEAEYQRAQASVSQAENQIVSTRAGLVQAEASLDRIRRLRESGSAAQATLDDVVAAQVTADALAASAADGLAVAQAALAQAGAARELAQLNLDRSEIKAPMDGLIVERGAELGAISGAGGAPLFRLIAGGEIELSADVIETALLSLSVGDPAEIDVAGVGRVEGKVRLLPASVDALTRLGEMRISLTPDPGLRPGLFASGAVVTARREAVTVPATAVLADDKGEWVQVVEDDVVHTQAVTAGLLWQARREIVSGLAEGQVVIVRSGAFFRDGDQVRPVASEADQASETAASEAAAPPSDAELAGTSRP